ncbi:MAG: HD domain-containing protein [Coriobacteriia bacterium]|nr:HD domain-containing protein [Coriobacteriia bacterium]
MRAYLAQRTEFIASARPSIEAARELSALTDEAVRELSRTASSLVRGRTALVALGGWGAGGLLPSSDLDVLVLSDSSSSALKPYVEAILYPLWDAGLKVGHQVRSPKEQLHGMRADLATCTAALTGRVIDGDVAWAQQVLASCAADAKKRSKRVLRELAARPRPGSPYALEPDLKEDAGGRRDYDELVWTCAVLTGTVQREPSALLAARLSTSAELAAISEAADTISAARFTLARAELGNRMSLDAAEILGTDDAERVQLALATTALALTRIRRRVAGVRDRGIAEDDSPLGAQAIYALLDAGERSLDALEEAAQAGRLDALIPGFRALMTVRRPGIGHQLTVGAHSLRAAVLSATMPTTGALAESRRDIGDLHTLQVAALAHDLGKAKVGSGHAERGTAPAADAARRFGLTEAAALDVADLVRHHLALAETATRIDIDDEDAVLSAAARIGRRGLLAPLHLLTAADSLATGPATWSAWKASLVGKLVTRLDAALSAEIDGAGLAIRGEAVRGEALAALAVDDTLERAFISEAPLRYLADRDPGAVTRDARLVAALTLSASAVEARIAVGSGPTADSWSVTVVAPDRPELLSRIAGAMSLAGLDILAVDAYGASGGLALDHFVVASATLKPVTPETFTSLERFLRAALGDRLELETRLAERRRHYPARVQTPVQVSMVTTGFDTAVRVSAPDRPGLLHDLARAVSATGLNIRWAKALTVDGIALDTFHVTDAEGGPVDNPGILGHLAMRLREIE